MEAKKQTVKLPQKRSPGNNKYISLDVEILFMDMVKKGKNSNEETSRRDLLFLQSDESIWGLPLEKIFLSNILVKRKHWQQL